MSALFQHIIVTDAMLKYAYDINFETQSNYIILGTVWPDKNRQFWEVVAAKLVERALPMPEVHGPTPVISKIYIKHLITCLLSTVWKDQINKKEAGNGPLFWKKLHNLFINSSKYCHNSQLWQKRFVALVPAKSPPTYKRHLWRRLRTF